MPAYRYMPVTLGMIHGIAVPIANSSEAMMTSTLRACVHLVGDRAGDQRSGQGNDHGDDGHGGDGAGSLGLGLVHVILDDVELVHGDHLVAEQHAHSAAERLVEVTRGGELREVAGDSEILERHLGAFHVL